MKVHTVPGFRGYGPPPVSPIKRVLAGLDRSDKEGCWIWTKARSPLGYGRVRIEGRKSTFVHRVMMQHVVGRRLLPLEEVCHHCDNPPCARPSHLFIGSRKDNAQDAMRKGRGTFGETHPEAKLTTREVEEIRRDPRSSYQVSLEYDVTARHIRRIRQGIRRTRA